MATKKITFNQACDIRDNVDYRLASWDDIDELIFYLRRAEPGAERNRMLKKHRGELEKYKKASEKYIATMEQLLSE